MRYPRRQRTFIGRFEKHGSAHDARTGACWTASIECRSNVEPSSQINGDRSNGLRSGRRSHGRHADVVTWSCAGAQQGISVIASKRNKRARTTRQAAQIGMLAPVVAGARMVRMTTRADFSPLGAMSLEKAMAFNAASTSMAVAACQAYVKSWAVLAAFWMPGRSTLWDRYRAAETEMARLATAVVDAPVRPIHKVVLANSRRLGR
jgi:hypothetical protein